MYEVLRFPMNVVAAAALAVVALTPSLTRAIDSAQEAIVTPGYEKAMRTSEMMKRLDANGDGKVTMEEGEAYFRKLFATLDTNHDGKLDKTEWQGAAKSPEVVSLSTGGYARALSSMDMMARCDSSGDHLVSEDEFLQVHKTLFEHMAQGGEFIDRDHWLADRIPIKSP